ncbi:hypothetical protein ACLOJK_013097 [Asimina triloba]
MKGRLHNSTVGLVPLQSSALSRSLNRLSHSRPSPILGLRQVTPRTLSLSPSFHLFLAPFALISLSFPLAPFSLSTSLSLSLALCLSFSLAPFSLSTSLPPSRPATLSPSSPFRPLSYSGSRTHRRILADFDDGGGEGGDSISVPLSLALSQCLR